LCVFDLGETYFFRNEERYPSIKTPFEAIKLRGWCGSSRASHLDFART